MEPKQKKHKVALVQGEDFRCAAYQDEVGEWRGIYSGRALPPVLEVLAEVEQPVNMPPHVFGL